MASVSLVDYKGYRKSKKQAKKMLLQVIPSNASVVINGMSVELDKNGIGVITYTKKGETVTLPRESLNFTKFFTALVYIYSTDSRSYTYSKNVKDLLRRYTNDLSVLHANTTGKLGLVDMFNNALSDIFEFGDLEEAGESIGIFMENLFNNRGLSVIATSTFHVLPYSIQSSTFIISAILTSWISILVRTPYFKIIIT